METVAQREEKAVDGWWQVQTRVDAGTLLGVLEKRGWGGQI